MKFKGIVSLIPARSGSKRIINKNIKLLGGYPLLAYSIFISRASYLIDETYVSTNASDIAETAFNYESKIVIRPNDLAQDTSTDLECILHFLTEYKKKKGIYPKNIVYLRPTTPFREVSEVERGILSFREENSSLRSVEEIPEAVEKHFKIHQNGFLIPICSCITLEQTNFPDQMFSSSYKGNGYIDILKTEHLLEYKSLYGNKIQPFITEKTVELDTPEEFELAQLILERKGKWDIQK